MAYRRCQRQSSRSGTAGLASGTGTSFIVLWMPGFQILPVVLFEFFLIEKPFFAKGGFEIAQPGGLFVIAGKKVPVSSLSRKSRRA
ncbi:MAG: hypothetical protein ABS92_14295 [Thiobacillus sp. SCN 63-374]|nr:MAG: hypothetical protein ABS92_14295 [Thiobacillus sp. SCN 63-374]